MSIWRSLRMLFSILVNRRRHRAAMEKLRSGFSKQRAIGAIVETYRAGDYETALSAADALKEIDPSSYHFFRGWLLMQLDRFDEAERHLRNSAVMRSDGLLAAIVHSSLGQLLLERQQYERALECFQTSLRYAPERGATHRDFADAWLRRGDPQQGLKWAELAVAKERVSKMPEESRDLDLSEDLAMLAWAVACASRDRAKADRLVEEAVAVANLRRVAPSMAQVHVNSGKAYAALGDAARCREHFDAAAQIDPHGIWGRAAKAAAELQ